jgi:uncharacterized membrane protein (DUF373 family)
VCVFCFNVFSFNSIHAKHVNEFRTKMTKYTQYMVVTLSFPFVYIICMFTILLEEFFKENNFELYNYIINQLNLLVNNNLNKKKCRKKF